MVQTYHVDMRSGINDLIQLGQKGEYFNFLTEFFMAK